MPAKSVTLGLLAVACLGAAAGGAYVATWQHTRSAPPPVVQPPAALPADPGSRPADPSAGAPANPEPRPAPPRYAPGPTAASRGRGQFRAVAAPESLRAKPRVSAKKDAVSPAPQEVPPADTAAPPASAVESPASAVPADPIADAPRPWPGAGPAAPAPSPSASAIEAANAGQAPADRERRWEELIVPAQSVLGLQLETSVSSETARVEDRVEARITRDVMVDGKVAIPARTRAIGSVTLVERGGKVKERARIGFRFHTLQLPDATSVPVATETIYREGPSLAPSSSRKIGGSAVGGAIIGAIIGGGRGAAIGGGLGAAAGAAGVMAGERQTVEVRAGTHLSARTQAPLTVMVVQ